MNEFSILCRVLGSLYYRQPQDPLLVPLFTLIREGKLAASWPLEQDELLARLQKSCEMQSLATDYNALFVGEACSVPPYRSAWVEGSSEAEVRAFLSEHGIPTGEGPADHLGSLLLAASWLEDHAAEDQSETLELLFRRLYPAVVRDDAGESRSPCAHAVLAHHGAVDPRRHRRDVGRAAGRR
ncbi:chaperone, TorD family [Klebsiella pneumoniae]|uniref:Chaperone, TorD family n=1 Tax=Klebsiella pneumoniae TaxID=573 RepID=A0A378BFE1_KLEPN|nr:chaperone, TorD family [Klebsiella pneumoniae]